MAQPPKVAEPTELRAELERVARELGFVRFGVARAEALEPEGERLRRWLALGRHGSMDYMADTADVRVDPKSRRMLPSALSVIAMATPYARPEDAPRIGEGRIARYAGGRDYHTVLGKRTQKVAKVLRRKGFTARGSIDTMPVFERAWAQRAGIGFIGKNCCLIIPGIGSHVFLSTVITSAVLPVDSPMPERCGSCTLCLDRCPTSAFAAEREIDARRCISYATIEERGPIEPALRQQIGTWLFGCDVCQDVCPYNKTPSQPTEATEIFAARDQHRALTLEALLELDEAGHQALVEGSAIKRTGSEGLARNAAIVLGNVGKRRHLPVLQHASRTHRSAIVREAAAWAVGRIEERGE